MTNFKPDGNGKPGWYVSDETPIQRHEFTEANDLHLFPFDEDSMDPRLDCPDCDAFCSPENLAEAVDWALGHKCAQPR